MSYVAVIVPSFERAPDARLASFYDSLRLTVSWYSAGEPGEPPAMRIAKTRNYGARRSDHSEIFVFNDADSICMPEQVVEMVKLAEDAPGLVFGFTVYSRLADVPVTHWSAAFTAPVEWQMFNSLSSGCIAIRRECFEEVGGYDETWQYGFEDYDFAQRCAQRWPLRRVEGELYHLWHPRPTIEPEAGPDAERYERMYGRARV